jgi:predicted ATPase
VPDRYRLPILRPASRAHAALQKFSYHFRLVDTAAASLSMLSVEQIAARLVQRFRLLSGGTRTAMRRQQTLDSSTLCSRAAAAVRSWIRLVRYRTKLAIRDEARLQ